MSRSPRRVQATDWGALVSETRRETHFKFGKSELPVTDADLGRIGTLAERLFGAKGIVDVASGPIVGIQKSGRKVARREGSLVICGKKRAEVFAFKALSIELHADGEKPVFRRVKRGSHLIVKSATAITSVDVHPLHPVLTGDEYAALCRERDTEGCGTVKVTFRKLQLRLLEHHRKGILCHCGVWFGSRNSLLDHLHPLFGSPVGAITSKPASREEEPLRFAPIKSQWGTTEAVYTALPGNEWTGTITFSQGAPAGPVFLKCSSNFAIEPSSVSCSPETSVTVRLRSIHSDRGPALMQTLCLLVNIELIDGLTDMNFGPLLRIRLPHLTCNSLDDVNVTQHKMFCGGHSRVMRPLFKVGQSFHVYQSDDMLDELSGEKLRMNDFKLKLLQKMSRLKRP